MLFNEPKLLKSIRQRPPQQRARRVSVLFNEPKLLKSTPVRRGASSGRRATVLFNEPKLLKSMDRPAFRLYWTLSDSALQRAEIAEI